MHMINKYLTEKASILRKGKYIYIYISVGMITFNIFQLKTADKVATIHASTVFKKANKQSQYLH